MTFEGEIKFNNEIIYYYADADINEDGGAEISFVRAETYAGKQIEPINADLLESITCAIEGRIYDTQEDFMADDLEFA